MVRVLRRVFLGFSLFALAPATASAQEWAPPGRDMPSMPRQADLQGDWLSARSAWFRGVDGIAGIAASGLRANGQAGANGFTQMVRFSNGPVPVVVWSDRDGDGRCDMIEIFRNGSVIYQLIDADYDGTANVLRVYDADGKLLRQNPV